MRFANRNAAGKMLADQLVARGYGADDVVLALPRGGIPVGYEVALKLQAPLDVFLVRKLGFPGNEEFAMGAIASGGTIVLDEQVIARAQIPQSVVESVIQKETSELQRRDRAYRDGRRMIDVAGRNVILVDDGLATGQTLNSSVRALRSGDAKSITVAVPVGAEETCQMLTGEADHVICGTTPDPFYAVGMWYEDFTQTTDEQVREWLRLAYGRERNGASSSDSGGNPSFLLSADGRSG